MSHKKLRHFFIQSEVKPKPTVIRSHPFFRASPQLRVFASSCYWSIGFSVSFVIDQSDQIGFAFPTIN